MTRTHRSRPAVFATAFLATAFLALSFVLPAAAQPADGWDRFRFTVGAQDATTDSRVSLVSGPLAVPVVDLEDTFGLEESDELLWAEVEWLFGRRAQLSLSYFDHERDAVRRLDQEVVFGDVVFPVAGEVATGFDLRVAELAFTYWLVQRPGGGLGLRLGVSALDFEARATARVSVPILGPVVIEQETAAAELPVPTVGLEARLMPSRAWRIDAEAAWLPRVEVEDWEGEALSFAVDVEFRPFDNVGFGLGWSHWEIEADLEEPDLTGELDLSVEGPRAFVRLAF